MSSLTHRKGHLSLGKTSTRVRAHAPRLEELGIEEGDAGIRHVSCQPSLEFRGRVNDWVADIRQARQRGDTVLFVAESAGRAERTIEILQDYEILAIPVERAEDSHAATMLVATGSLSRGFRLADAALQVYAETDVFEEERRAPEKRHNLAKTFLSDLRDLKVGDLVVHVDHGIGEFVGLKQLSTVGRPTGGSPAELQEFLELRYHGDAKLFVPVEGLDVIQKYTGGVRPALDRLGGTTWEKAKTRVKKAMRDMAEELLKLYAQRKAVPGHAFSPDTHWQEEFEAAFPYELTPDQVTAITDIKKDMESARRWTACSAATSVTARPKWRCARRSKRSWTASRWPSSRRPQCSRSSIRRRFANGSRASRWPSKW
jgi:transcription-repair coupling factor (superfamily II helicase)